MSSANINSAKDNPCKNATGATGGTGGTGQAGGGFASVGTGQIDQAAGTGGTGGPGETGPQPSNDDLSKVMRGLTDDSVSVDEYSHMQMLREFHGSTGGVGGVPENFEKVVDDKNAPAMMVKELRKKLSGMENDELVVELGNQYKKCMNIVGKVNAVGTVHAIRIGMAAVILKSRIPHGSWHEFCSENLLKPFGISKRTLEKYMNIAQLNHVESYVEYGVEVLSEIATAYNRLSSEDKKEIDKDVVAFYLKNQEKDTSHEERKDRLEAAVWVLKLKRVGVKVEVGVVEAFFAVGGSLNQKRLQYLKMLAEKDEGKAPAEFINKVIGDKGDWKKALPDEKQGASEDASLSESVKSSDHVPEPSSKSSPKVSSIIEQTVVLYETISSVLKSDEIQDMDITELERLMEAVSELKTRLASKQDEAA